MDESRSAGQAPGDGAPSGESNLPRPIMDGTVLRNEILDLGMRRQGQHFPVTRGEDFRGVPPGRVRTQ
eukprot:292359-Pyramimonas_sp.AAC.1